VKQNEVFGFRFFAALPNVDFAFFTAFVPFYADLLDLHDAGGRKIRRSSRNLDGI
jgi:hypothetical protein